MLATATKVATKTKPLNPSQLNILEMFSFATVSRPKMT